MKREAGLLVVNRLQLLRVGTRSEALSRRAPSRGGSWDDVFTTYRGFDGLAWPAREHPRFATQDGLASVGDVELVDDYVAELGCAAECDVVILARQGWVPPRAAEKHGWFFAGFDLGCFESEHSHFSVVLNEVLCGGLAEMRRFSDALNEQLLVSSVDECTALLGQRRAVAAAGADVEELEDLEAIGIFVRSLNGKRRVMLDSGTVTGVELEVASK